MDNHTINFFCAFLIYKMLIISIDRSILIRWKIYIDRAKMHIGYVQFLMIAFVLLEAYKESTLGKLIFDNMLISMLIIFYIYTAFVNCW